MVYRILEQLQWRCQGKYRLRLYVGEYLTRCAGFGEQLQLITIWCLGPTLVNRWRISEQIEPLSKERKVISDFRWLHDTLGALGLLVNHLVFLVGGGFERAQIPEEVKEAYASMIRNLIDESCLDAVIERRTASPPLLESALKREELRTNGAVIRQAEEYFEHVRRNYPFKVSREESLDDAVQEAMVNAAEARGLVAEFGEFLLIPVEPPYRYQFHDWGVHGFTDRIVPCTQFYPWRPDK